ncbi:hypothetical protein [Streptomyces sp. NBC_01304]|uniref:hypothetical protein n=1 Tax=Streptomyces sp. NBC_01304 TaxID=2903818 RepID=UPI002E13B3BC|nr:hypothetical protein OG430_33530 [Streptomyces sp. NBC_01304]
MKEHDSVVHLATSRNVPADELPSLVGDLDELARCIRLDVIDDADEEQDAPEGDEPADASLMRPPPSRHSLLEGSAQAWHRALVESALDHDGAGFVPVLGRLWARRLVWSWLWETALLVAGVLVFAILSIVPFVLIEALLHPQLPAGAGLYLHIGYSAWCISVFALVLAMTFRQGIPGPSALRYWKTTRAAKAGLLLALLTAYPGAALALLTKACGNFPGLRQAEALRDALRAEAAIE